MTDDNRDKLIHIAEQYRQLVQFYNIAAFCADKIAEIRKFFPDVDNTRFSVATYYRLFIPQFFAPEIEKVIYLDADIIVNLDIAELWQIELEDHPLAAARNLFSPGLDPLSISGLLREGFAKVEDYFNAGVLLMNLKVLRDEEDNILSGIKFIGENPKCNLGDQDVLNYLFSTRNLKLPTKFNRLVKMARNYGDFKVKNSICHYVAGKYSLGLNMGDPFNRLWWSYFIKTPWFGIDTIGKILQVAKDSMYQQPVAPPGKSRVFVVDEEHADLIEKNFSVRDAEKVIVVDHKSEKSLRKLLDLMNDLKGNNVFFVGIPNIDSRLLNFAEGKDFVNVSAFYSPMWMNLTNNYNLLLSM